MTDTFLADFDADRARRRNQSVGRAQQAITLNSSTAPEQASRAQRDARLLGIPTAAVLGDPMFSAEAKALRDKEYLAQAPAASRWLSDDDNAAVAHDQVQELSTLEQMLRRGVRGGADVLGNIGKSLYAGIPRTSAGVVGLTEALGDVAGALNPFAAAERGLTAAGVLRGPTSEQNRRQTSQAYRQRLMNQAAALRPQTDNALASAAYSGLESVVPSILGIAATLASGGSATPAAALLAAPIGGEAYGQARDAGKGLAPSLIYGVGQGGAEAVGERIGLGPLFDGLKVGSPFLQTLIKTQISEQLGEQATTVLQDFNEWVTLNPEKTVGQFLQERPNAALQTAIATAVGSAATTTGVYTGNRATQELLSFADRRANAQASRVRAEQFNEAADAAAGNPVRERSPERFEQFLKSAAGDEQVFVPAEQVASFFQSNPDLDQWMDEWDIRDQVNAALVSGADVVFDQSTYLARVAGTPAHEAWKNEIRHGLDAMSMREADEFEKTGEESLRDSFDAAVSVAESEAAALAPEARVADDLFSQLRTAGYTADAARTQAALAARAFARRAERSPQRFADAYAAYESAGLTVQQEFPQVIRENLDRIDVMIEALRKGRAAPTEQRMFGRSLMEFLSQEGGVIDTGGELQALGADSWHRPKQGGRAFRRRFIRSQEQGGNAYAPDQAALRAVEAGYLPEGATGNDLFEAVREELAGRPVYSQGFERNTTAINNAAALNELEQLISQLDGVTLESSNAEIKAALERAAAAAPGYGAGESYNQAPKYTVRPPKKLYRGIVEGAQEDGSEGLGTFHLGRGLYSTADKSFAKKYALVPGRDGRLERSGRVVEISPEIAWPRNPLVLRGSGGAGSLFNDWMFQNSDFKRLSDFNKAYPDPADFVKAKGYDGVVAGDEVVRYPPDGVDRILYQGTPFTGPRGQISFTNGQSAIRLFESRDLSTFAHEFGHLTLEMMIDDALDPNASAEVKADMQTVLDWFSREAGRTITVDDIGVDQHELWARGSERYLMEGKAPSLALRDVFRTFSTWLKSIYRTLRNLNAPITDDVRAVMDRLLASDAEIEQARQTMGVEAGFETAEQAGMTGAEFEAYKARVERARRDAEDSVVERVTRAIRRRVTAEWRTAEDELRPDVIAEVDAMPDVAAVEWLVTSKQGLTKETVVAMLGDEAGVAMLPKRVPPLVRDNGMHPDEVAEIVGYRNGHELLNALMDYEAEKRALVAGGDKRSVRQARIDRLLMERMLDRYGDPLNDGSIEREALDALHSDRRSEILAAELGVLARRSGNSPSPLSAIKDWARGLVGGRPVREARSGKYLRAERTAASAAQKALAAGDRQEAFKQKQAQTLNAVLYAEASRAEQYVETAVVRLKRLSGRVLSIDVDYRDQIESLLEQYDLREVSGRQVQRRRSLLEFVKEREEAGEPVNVPPELLAAANKTHYSELTVDEFRALDEAVQHLAHLGRLKRKLIVNGEQRDLDRMADEAWTVAQALPDVKGAAIAGSATPWQKAVRAGAQFEASLVKAQEFFRLLDGGVQDGLFSTVLDKAGQEAATRKLDLTEAFWRPVVEAERAIPNKVKDTWTDTLEGHPLRNPQNGETVELKRRDLIGLARHTGTLSNFEKMAKGWGVIEQDADAYAVASARDQFILWLDGQMDPTEWLYVQAQWDAHERLRPEYFAVARKVEGFEPEAVEAAPLPVTSAGPLAGGYAPVSYHPDYDAQAQRREQRDAGSIFGDMLTAGPRPDNGATNSRTSYVGPVKIALEDGRYAAEKQLTYTAYAEYVTNSLKFLRHPVVRQTMIAKLGVEAYNTFEPWIAGQVRDESVVDPSAHPMVKIARQARSNMTAAVLLGSFTVLAAQPGGLAQSIAHNGPVGMAKGVANAVRLAAGRNLYPYITGLSDFMRARVEQGDLDRDYRLAMQRAQGAEGIKERALVLSGKAIALVDFYLVSAPTWLAAYDRALVEGKDEAGAVYLADKAVRITQGGGRAIDQSGIMRANEVTKMVTFAYGWSNALYNMQRSSLADYKNGHERLHNAIRLAAVLVLPALFDAVLSGDTPDAGDDPEEAIKNSVGWFIRNVFFGAFAGVPIVRDVAGGAERLAQGKFVGSLGQTALGRLSDSILKLGVDAWAAVDEDREVNRRWPAHVINATGLALGLPGTSQIARTTNYIQDVRDGEQNPDTVLDWMTGLLKGPQQDQE